MTMPSLDIVTSGNISEIRPHNPFKPSHHVKPGIYDIQITEDGPILVFKGDSYKTPAYVFGKPVRSAIKTMYQTFERRAQSMGAILSGRMGSGKTITAECICNKVIENGGVVLQINTPLPPSILESLRSVAKGDLVYYFQEFSVNYTRYGGEGTLSQNKLLEFFSSQSLQKSLFLLTLNDVNQLSDLILERPGRFLFHVRYRGIDKTALEEIIEQLEIEPLRANWLTRYVERLGRLITVDQVIEILRTTSTCQTVDELESAISILNVSKPMTRFKLISSLKGLVGWRLDEVAKSITAGEFDEVKSVLKFIYHGTPFTVKIGDELDFSKFDLGVIKIIPASDNPDTTQTFECVVHDSNHGEPF